MKRVILCLVAVWLTTGSPTAADPPQYALQLLGLASDVEDMNTHGEVVGGFSAPLSPDMRAYVAGPCAGCPADLNGDGVVDAADLANLLGQWG